MKNISLFIIFLALAPALFPVSLSDIEKEFQEQNLQLLIKQYEIESSRAQILQARLWENPSISFEQGTYNNERHFNVLTESLTSRSQSTVSFQQLIELGGKREKRIQAKSLLKGITEYELYDLTRALKYELRSAFFSLYYSRAKMDFYQTSSKSISDTISRMEKSYLDQDITLSEIMRLKAILFQLDNESANLSVHIQEQEDNLKLLLNQTSSDRFPSLKLNENRLDRFDIAALKVKELQDSGEKNRPDVLIAELMVKYEKTNLSLARAEVIPDVSLGVLWDKNGAFGFNYFGMTASMPLPINDRNQGNIKSAEQTVKSSELQKQMIRNKLKKEIYTAWKKANEKDKIYKSYAKNFVVDYHSLAVIMLKNYNKRYITIIEFADFFDAYRQSMDQFLDLQIERLQSFENLNFVVGSNLLELEK
ncbi:TolC family protein [Leptospira ilyithenensis]|uniref:TolC family protein n=1 Tax=Leptospira ilyithenensis TaxID=2484901 RepID=A0A4R9LSV5_9LEPT|nr:TolC family protein [Leptospira ilyithenensis]TGN10504.1 TolC family protein [Leptospira ilyithenensis]